MREFGGLGSLVRACQGVTRRERLVLRLEVDWGCGS